MVWKSLLPYRVEFEVTTTRVERPHLLEGDAVGELSGVGRWRLYEQDGATAVLYEWNVATSKAWMNLLAPVARPVFEWNHDWVMARGGEGIAQLLGCSSWPAAKPADGTNSRMARFRPVGRNRRLAIFLALALSPCRVPIQFELLIHHLTQ